MNPVFDKVYAPPRFGVVLPQIQLPQHSVLVRFFVLPHSPQRGFSFTNFSVVFDVCFAIFPQTRKNRRIFTAVYNKPGTSHKRAWLQVRFAVIALF
jgi:hypothetical protein